MEQQTPEAPATEPAKEEQQKIDVAVWYRDAAQVLRQREQAWPRLKAQKLGALARHGWPREAMRVAQLVTILRELEGRRAAMERLAEAMRLAHHVMGAQAAMAMRDLDYLEAQESEFPLAEWPESVRTLGDLLRTGGFAPGPETCPHCGSKMKALNGNGVWRNAYECEDASICGLRINGEGEVMCRQCGCTESRACEDSCYWVEENLCSVCHFSNQADELADQDRPCQICHKIGGPLMDVCADHAAAEKDQRFPAALPVSCGHGRKWDGAEWGGQCNCADVDAPAPVAILDPTEPFPVDPEDGDFSLSVRVVPSDEEFED